MKKLISAILIGVMTLSLSMNAFAENNSTTVAVYAKNGMKIAKEGNKSSVNIFEGDVIVPNGDIVLRDRSCVSETNKIYYTNEQQLKLIEADQWTTNPALYSEVINFDYDYPKTIKPEFKSENLKAIDSIAITNSDVIVNEDSYIKEVSIENDGSLVFDIPKGDTLYAKIDMLTMNGSNADRGTVKIIGGGTVYLEVGKITASHDIHLNYPKGFVDWKTYTNKVENTLILSIENEIDELYENLYVEGDVYFKNSVKLDGSFKICGNLVSNGDINYLGINRNVGDFRGQEFNVLGQVYAPNGLVHVVGNARIRGQVICDKFEYYDSSSILYKEPNYIKISEKETPSPTPTATATPAPTTEPTEPPVEDIKYENGVYAEYYNLPGFDNDSSKRMARIEKQIKNNWGEKTTPSSNTINPNAIELENFAAIYKGYIEAPESGNYTFSTYSDDGVEFIFDNKTLINDWELISLEYKKSESVYLEKGQKYPYQLKYFQGPINATVFLFWEKDGQLMQQVPASSYFVEKETYNKFIEPVFTNLPKGTGDGLNAYYYDTVDGAINGATPTKVETINDMINLEFPEQNLGFSMGLDGYFQAKYTGNVKLIVRADDGVTVSVNGKQVINEYHENNAVYYNAIVPVVVGEFYQIEIAYNNIIGPGSIILMWETDDGINEVIPKEFLYTAI